MPATAPRRIRRRRRGLPAALEPLETRALLAAQPAAVADAYMVNQGQTLTISFPRNELRSDTNAFGPTGPFMWTAADGPISVWRTGSSDVNVSGGPNDNGMESWRLGVIATSGQPLQPGTYYGLEHGAATTPGNQAALLWMYGQNSLANFGGQFTIQHIDAAPDNTVLRLDADFTVPGLGTGSVHYTTGPRGLLDNDSGPADALTASLATGPAHGSLSLNTDGTFSYSPAPGFLGDDSFTYIASDGVTTSAPATVTLHVLQINQAPSFTKGPDVAITSTGAPQSFPHWATNLSPGTSAIDAGQSLSFSVVGDNNSSLFAQGPTVDSAGNLTFTPVPNANGTATISLALHDSGGTANGGQDTSPTQTFTITLSPPVQYTGHLLDVYPQANGANLTPLAGRGVFDDANGNGVPDPGEAVAYTNNVGLYTFSLPAGNHTLRAVPMPGWVVPAGYSDSVLTTSYAAGNLYTTMAQPGRHRRLGRPPALPLSIRRPAPLGRLHPQRLPGRQPGLRQFRHQHPSPPDHHQVGQVRPVRQPRPGPAAADEGRGRRP